MTLAPELKGAAHIIRRLAAEGVVVSLGHSNATLGTCLEAVRLGATHVTHLFNAMSGLQHREPGLAAAALLLEELSVEIIADGIHVHPDMVRLAFKLKGIERTTLITDGTKAMGSPDGSYTSMGRPTSLKDGAIRLRNGTLAGSAMSMNEAVRNMVRFTGIPIEQALVMATRTPAETIGLAHRKGLIRRGLDADFVVIDRNGTVHATVVAGRVLYTNS
jgi:N-acetylglucosamine-6-phosphate deacetylase